MLEAVYLLFVVVALVLIAALLCAVPRVRQVVGRLLTGVEADWCQESRGPLRW